MHRTRIFLLIGCFLAAPCAVMADPLAKVPAPVEVKKRPPAAAPAVDPKPAPVEAKNAPAAVPTPAKKVEQSAADKKAGDKKAADKKEKDKKPKVLARDLFSKKPTA